MRATEEQARNSEPRAEPRFNRITTHSFTSRERRTREDVKDAHTKNAFSRNDVSNLFLGPHFAFASLAAISSAFSSAARNAPRQHNCYFISTF